MKRFFSHVALNVKMSLKDKGSLFWSFIYPILLLTLMAVAFSGLQAGQKPIAVAVDSGHPFAGALQQIDILDVQNVGGDEALNLLRDKDVDGIFRADCTLLVRGEGMNETILREIGSELKKAGSVYAAGRSLDFTKQYVERGDQKEGMLYVTLSSSLGMFALYGYFAGISIVHHIQANLSPLAARLSTTPVSRLSYVSAGLFSGVAMSSLQTIGLLFYLKWVWKVDYLADPWRTLLLVLAAGFFGIAVGLFLGASNRWPLKAKVPLGISLMLLLSAASGMMGPPLRLFIEKNLPWLNRYNPVNMISRTIYRLNVLESTKEFSENVAIFFVAGVFLCIASLLFMRKRQFKSL